MLLQVNDLIERGFDISPATIYGWTLAAMVILVASFSYVIRFLFMHTDKKVEKITGEMAQERREFNQERVRLESDIVTAKLKSVEVLRDVLNALDRIAVDQQDGKDEVIREIQNLRTDIREKMTTIH